MLLPLRSAMPRRASRGRIRVVRSAGCVARRGIETTVLSSLPSAPQTDGRAELRRRFVEAARRAQIVTLVNRARTEAELGELVTAELCEAFEAEIAFVLAHGEDGHPGIVGAYGLRADEAERLPAHGVLDRSIELPQLFEGPDLLSVGARALVLAPFSAVTARGVVGVARLHDEGFNEAEAALLEAVAASIAHALERLRLAEERDRLYRQAHEQAQAARVIGSIADGVVLVDDVGVVQLWNPAAEAITGLARDAVIDRPLREAIPGWAGDDPARRHRGAGALAVDSSGALRRGNRLRVPRPDRGTSARAAEGGLHRDGLPRAPNAARRGPRRCEDAAPRG